MGAGHVQQLHVERAARAGELAAAARAAGDSEARAGDRHEDAGGSQGR